jgi:phenylalanyl-tRNA synthetase beta chain
MKFSLSWLRTWLETASSLDEILATLNAIGLEVEGVENKAAGLAPFVIAQVVEARPHPNADRLRVCRVNAGGAELRVVCGAPNARTGMRAVFAPAGAVVPASGLVLKVGEIRGEKSEGMLVSFRELALGEEHDGIIELPADAPVGANYAAWAGLDDPVIEIAVTPNRGDALSVRGIARDLAAAGLGRLKDFAAPPITESGPSAITWVNEFAQACPWVLGRTVRGVKNGPSPDWLRRRLESVGLRPINALVDITNFFTLDLGRPLHVFDAGRVTGPTLTLRPGAGECFEGLNNKEITVGPEDCVIADAAGVQSAAGIIGGAATGCDEATTAVFIECALFDRVRTAQSGQRIGVFSDARARFERGIDSQHLPAFLDAATAMVIELCGGTASQITRAGARPEWARTARLRFARIAAYGGSTIGPDEAVASLERLGFTVTARDETEVTVAVPSWRNDIAAPPALDQAAHAGAAQAAIGAAEIEPECDLLEEVLRLRGMDAIAPVSLPVDSLVPPPVLTPAQARTGLARRVLAARGLLECVTFSFVAQATAALVGGAPPALRVANPIAADLDQMRGSVLAGLFPAAARNAARGAADFGLFEIGPAYLADRTQQLVAAGLRTGAQPLTAFGPPRRWDLFDAKADAFAVLEALGTPMDALTTTQGAAAHYHPGQSGLVRQGPKTVLAQFGTLHPAVCAVLDVPPGTVAFELYLAALPEPKRRRRAALVLNPLQPVRRDFAFLAPDDMPAETVLRAVRGADRNAITNAVLFDRYQGQGVPTGQVSLAIAVTLQPADKSFTEAELEAITNKIIEDVNKKTKATLRS